MRRNGELKRQIEAVRDDIHHAEVRKRIDHSGWHKEYTSELYVILSKLKEELYSHQDKEKENLS